MAPMQKPGRFCTETGISISPFSSLHRDTPQDLEVSRGAGQASACGLSRRSRSPPRGRPRPRCPACPGPSGLWRGRESPWGSPAGPVAVVLRGGQARVLGPRGRGPPFPRGGPSREARGPVTGGVQEARAGRPCERSPPAPPPARPPLWPRSAAPHAGSAPAARGGLAQGQLPLQKPGQWDQLRGKITGG